MRRVASRSGIALLLALLLVAGIGFFVAEYVTNAETWVMSEGSPHVYNAGNIGCGTVVDREGTVLLDMTNGRTYADSKNLRKTTVHWLGDRYGAVNAPALTTHAGDLAGFDLLNGVYAYGDAEASARVSLSGKAQLAALEAMDGKKGTVAVYNYQTGALLCAVTTPNYDPDNVPDVENDTTGKYEGMYVNRFTQSTYIPGSIYKIVTLAAALEELPDARDLRFTCNGSMELDGGKITCEKAHGKQSLKEAFSNSCNCAFAELTLRIGAEKMEMYVSKFGINDSIVFDGIETAKGNYQAVGEQQIDIGWSGVGQFNDQVNPCGFLSFVGAIANGGKGAYPYLVENVKVGDTRTYTARTQYGDTVLSAETARIVTEYMRNNVKNHYGDDNFHNLAVCAKTGTAEVGGDKKPNAMLAGFVSDSSYPLAFIVCVEDGGYGAKVCLPIASQVLEACVASMKSGG